MPNGYRWLGTSKMTTHSFDKWMIQTGEAALQDDFTDAYREPTELENRLIDLVITQVSTGHDVPYLPYKFYDKVKHVLTVDGGSICWVRPEEEEGSNAAAAVCEGTGSAGSAGAGEGPPPKRARVAMQDVKKGEKGGISASVYERMPNDHPSQRVSIRWLDAIPFLAGLEDDSTFFILLVSSILGERDRTSGRRLLYAVECRLAVRQVVDTTIEVPTLRQWGGVFQESALQDAKTLVEETVARSLMDGGHFARLHGDAPPVEEEAPPVVDGGHVDGHMFGGWWTRFVDNARLRDHAEYRKTVIACSRLDQLD